MTVLWLPSSGCHDTVGYKSACTFSHSPKVLIDIVVPCYAERATRVLWKPMFIKDEWAVLSQPFKPHRELNLESSPNSLLCLALQPANSITNIFSVKAEKRPSVSSPIKTLIYGRDERVKVTAKDQRLWRGSTGSYISLLTDTTLPTPKNNVKI